MTPVIREIATGLTFPEGPIALPDGDVLLVEIARGTLSRVKPDGRVEVVAHTGGGPNGAAMGPDGKVWICNNGGFQWIDMGGGRMRGSAASPCTWATYALIAAPRTIAGNVRLVAWVLQHPQRPTLRQH